MVRRGGTRSAVIRGAAMTAAMALLVAACGSRVDSAQEPAAVGAEPATPVAQRSDGGGDPEAATFGDEPAPCGPGDASGATDVGLTDDTIKIGVITDRKSSFVPGINEGLWFGTSAWAKWCNGLGGINGRTIELIEYDADIFSYRDRILEACDEVFALVGGGGIQDDLGAQEAVDCGLAEVAGFTVNAKKNQADRVFEAVPNPAGTFRVLAGRYFLDKFPEVADAAAYLYTDLPIGVYQSDRHVQAYESIGYDFKVIRATQLNEENWRTIVLELMRDDIEYLSLTSSTEEARNLLKAMSDQDWMPAVVDFEANFYDQKLLDSAGSAADGIFVRLAIWPFEEADLNPATAQLVQLLSEETSTPPSFLAVQAFSAGLLFSTAASAIDGDLTRDALLEEVEGIHEWTGLGLHAATDPGARIPASCFLLLQVRDGAYERVYPATPDAQQDGYACNDNALVELDLSKVTNYEPGATAG